MITVGIWQARRGGALGITLALLGAVGCSSGTKTPPPDAGPQVLDAGSVDAGAAAVHSSSIVISPDGTRLYVVNADADSVSVVDTGTRSLVTEISLATSPPVVDSDGGFTPSVMPRTLALSPDGQTLYVTGERSGMLYKIDLAMSTVVSTVPLGSEPIGVVVSPDGASVFVSCAADAIVFKLATAGAMSVTGQLQTSIKPWALALLPDGTLLTTNFLTPPQVTAIDSLSTAMRLPLKGTFPIQDTPPRISALSAPLSDPRLAHGQVRGFYDLAPRPGTDELWIPHLMLGTDSAQAVPAEAGLDFETTVFPTVSVFHADGVLEVRMSINANDVPGVNGAFSDVVSGPHAITFTKDGAYAFVVDTNSEDILVLDANAHLEAFLLRPLPGHMPEGIVLSPDEQFAYVDERNSGDVAVLDVTRTDGGISLQVDPMPTISRLMQDPMSTDLRLGQHLFYSANSDEYPITTNHWVACASCHLEGGSDAVIWRFLQGPRDTPSNAGGIEHTGFLLRTADMRTVQDYWRIVDSELGGDFDGGGGIYAPLMDALADYVNHGIPLPIPPSLTFSLNPAQVARGEALFFDNVPGISPLLQCSTCHTGAWFTDSAQGNPGLQLDAGVCGENPDGGPPAPCVTLHNVGTCVYPAPDGGGPYADVPHNDIWGDYRDGCSYDTPTLRGINDTPPYLHNGAANTLMDVLTLTAIPDGGALGTGCGMSYTGQLDAGDLDALVEYLRTL